MTRHKENDINQSPDGADHAAKTDLRQKWPFWIGISGRNKSESMAAFVVMRTFDEMKRRNALSSRFRKQLEYWFATLYCRLWITSMMALLGAFWAEDRQAFLIMVGFGVVVDAFRNRLAPDLSVPIAVFVKKIEEDRKDQEKMRRHRKLRWRWVNWSIYIIGGYVVLIILIDMMLGQDILESYFSFFAKMYDFASPFMEILREHPADLRSRGYDYRALLTEHIYTVNLIGWGICLVLTAFGSHRHALTIETHSEYKENMMKKYGNTWFAWLVHREFCKRTTGSLIIVIVIILYITFAIDVDFSRESRFDYNIYNSSIPLLFPFCLIMYAIYFMMWVSYLAYASKKLFIYTECYSNMSESAHKAIDEEDSHAR